MNHESRITNHDCLDRLNRKLRVIVGLEVVSMLRVLLVVSLIPAVLGAQARPAPDALAKSLQQRYAGIRDFSADFVHSYRGGVLRTQTRERGTVTVKKPGRMRWIYTARKRKSSSRTAGRCIPTFRRTSR